LNSTTHTHVTKILFFSFWYPNRYKNNYAIFVKRHAAAIATVFETEILAVHIVSSNTFFKKEYLIETNEQGIKTHHFYLQSKFYKLLYVLLPLQYLLIKKLIDKEIKPNFKFQVIHSNVIFPCGIVGYRLSKHYQCKHIITEHWSKIDKFFKVSLYQWMGKKALKTADAITCVSQNLKKTVDKYHQNKMCFVVPNVIDSSHFYVNSHLQKFPVYTFTAVAHWHAPKNPFYFLNALQELVNEKSIPAFKVILIGTGNLLDEVAQKNYAFTIETPGNLNPEQLSQHLNQCHAFLHGSDFETFSVVIIEALLCGIPCVVSPVGVANEVITSANGFIAANQVNDWKEKIKQLLLTKYDHENISKSIGNKYSLMSVGKQFETVYQTSQISS